MAQDKWTLDELHAELARFEHVLGAARLKDSSIHTYVDRGWPVSALAWRRLRAGGSDGEE